MGFENIDTTLLNSDVLPLFSISNLNWTNDYNIIDFIIEANTKLEPYLTKNYTIKYINTANKNVVAIEIINNPINNLIFIANYGDLCDVNIDLPNNKYRTLFGTIDITNKEQSKLIITMEEFSYIVLELI